VTARRYRLEEVTSSRGAMFDHAYGALAAEFGPRGELERREVIARWLDAQSSYHLLIARDEKGEMAAVRDCHVLIDAAAKIAVVYLAHVLVLPPYRRTGLGALLRGAPIALARKALHRAGLDAASVDILIAAEMEHPEPSDTASLVRLVVYGKEGFAAIDPAELPYFQPDFRDLRALPPGTRPSPVPLLAVVRWLGHEDATTIPARLGRAFVKQLYAVFGTHVPREHLAALEAETLGVLTRTRGESDLTLVPLPRVVGDPPDLHLAASRRTGPPPGS
jgi:GNAT superfamily N-acetyltransferase